MLNYNKTFPNHLNNFLSFENLLRKTDYDTSVFEVLDNIQIS